jgi:hypothetical protein
MLVSAVSLFNHMVRWLIGHTPSLSKGTTRTYQMARGCNDTSNLLMLPLTLRRGRHKTPHNVRASHEQTPLVPDLLQAAPSHLGGGNHQEKQRIPQQENTQVPTRCKITSKYTWITQSHFEYVIKQERWVRGELLSSKGYQECQNAKRDTLEPANKYI